MTGTRLVVVGDTLLDRDVDGTVSRLAPDAPVPVLDEQHTTSRAGGAGLAATLAAADGAEVVLVTALGTDGAAGELRTILAAAGVSIVDLGLDGPTPEKIRLREASRPLLRLDRGAQPPPCGPCTAPAAVALASASAVLVSDYGRGLTRSAGLRAALAATTAPVVWDPHPRGTEPVPGALAVTPNARELLLGDAGLEADLAGGAPGPAGTEAGLRRLVAAGRRAAARWRCSAVVVTRGDRGSLVLDGGGPPLVVPTDAVEGDPCGAGDRFAATLATSLGRGAALDEAVTAATKAATAYVAAAPPPGSGERRPAPSGGRRQSAAPAAPRPGRGTRRRHRVGVVSAATAARLANGWRRDRTSVAVAGGCFDVLHAGHVALLQAAADLADVLVVAVNSDRSVRALKGPGRPVVPAADRMAVVAALGAVDAVTVFDEDTPAALLRLLRPDVFVKGGDYGHRPLPEEALLAGWGGQAVLLPYLAGRSTTGIIGRVSSA